VNFYDAELGVTTLKNLKDAMSIPDYYKVIPKHHKFRQKQKSKIPSHFELIKEIRNNLPCLFFSFSRIGCQKKAFELFQKNMFQMNPEISSFVRSKLSATSPEINKLDSTRILRQILPYGIAFHHAGMLPILKEIVEELFEKALIKVLYTTETFAVGVNMPAKSVCFESLRKFDGISFRMMNSKEYFQIAGRAGRRGIDREGFVYIMVERKFFEHERVKRIITSDTSPITSQFRLSVNTVLNLIMLHDEKEIDEILCKSFHSFQKYGKNFMDRENIVSHNAFYNYKKKLEKMGYVLGNTLTEKGIFASKIYSDEILIGEMFATDFYTKLNEYQMLMAIACLCYEAREKTEFFRKHHSQFTDELKKIIWKNEYLKHEKRFREIGDLTALVHPLYHGQNLLKIIENTNLLEGDIIRFFRQIEDKLRQVKSATEDKSLRDMLSNCQKIVEDCVGEFDTI